MSTKIDREYNLDLNEDEEPEGVEEDKLLKELDRKMTHFDLFKYGSRSRKIKR